MKNKKIFYYLIIVLLFQSCSYSISKRRYSRGFNLDFGFSNNTESKKKNLKNNTTNIKNNLEFKNKTIQPIASHIEPQKLKPHQSLNTSIKNKPRVDFVLSSIKKNSINLKSYFAPDNKNIDKDSSALFELAHFKAKTYAKRAKIWSVARYGSLLLTSVISAVSASSVFGNASSNTSLIAVFFIVSALLFLITIISYYVSIYKAYLNLNYAIDYADKNNPNHKNKTTKIMSKLKAIVNTSVIIYSIMVLLSAISSYSIVALLPVLAIIPFLSLMSKTKKKFNLKFNQ